MTLFADVEKHPSSLAALADIFWGIGGNISKWVLLVWNTFGGKQRKMENIWQILLLFNQKHYYFHQVLYLDRDLQFLIFAYIDKFHQWPYLNETSTILPNEAYFPHFSSALDMLKITHFLAEIVNPKILLAETFELFQCLDQGRINSHMWNS